MRVRGTKGRNGVKILVTLDFPPARGGIQRYLYDRVSHGFGRGDLVIAAGSSGREPIAGRLPCRVVRAGGPGVRLNVKLALPSVARLLRREVVSGARSCTVECGNVFAALGAAWGLRGTGIRYRVYAYGTELLPLQKSRSLTTIILRRVLRRAACIYVISRFTESLLRGARVNTPTELHPPRIALRKGLPQRFKQGPPEEGLRVLCVGRLQPHKGQEVLLRAVAAAPVRTGLHAVLIGNGPSRRNVRRLIRALGLTRRVELRTSAGNDELDAAYASTDVLVCPSMPTSGGVEGFGIVLLEAMAFGVPIIASRTGGIPEVVGDCAILVPPGDPERLRDALVMAVRDWDGMASKAKQARKRLRAHYVW